MTVFLTVCIFSTSFMSKLLGTLYVLIAFIVLIKVIGIAGLQTDQKRITSVIVITTARSNKEPKGINDLNNDSA